MQTVTQKRAIHNTYAPKQSAVKGTYLILPICMAALLLLVLSCVKVSFAVSLNGEEIGNVRLWENPAFVMRAVQHDAEYALGEAWEPPEVECHLVFQSAAPETIQVLKDKLYATVDGAVWADMIYVDGEPICAFETQTAAMDAIQQAKNSFCDEETVACTILERISTGRTFIPDTYLEDAETKLKAVLTVETTEERTQHTVLCFDVIIEEMDDWFEDEWELVTAGHNGWVETRYLQTNLNGSIQDTSIMSQNSEEPVTQVLRKGTKHRYSTGTYQWPVQEGWLTSRFGIRHIELGSTNHRGIDIAADIGTPIYASDGGEVIFAGTYYGYGKLVTIRHENGAITRYAHNSKILVSVGDKVEQGQQIAKMGSTGVSTGSHCHFEILPDGKTQVNPMKLLPTEWPKNLKE